MNYARPSGWYDMSRATYRRAKSEAELDYERELKALRLRTLVERLRAIPGGQSLAAAEKAKDAPESFEEV